MLGLKDLGASLEHRLGEVFARYEYITLCSITYFQKSSSCAMLNFMKIYFLVPYFCITLYTKFNLHNNIIYYNQSIQTLFLTHLF